MQKCVDIVVVVPNIKAIEQPTNQNNKYNTSKETTAPLLIYYYK